MAGGRPFITDNGNVTLDCGLEPPDDAAALDRAIRAIPGVVDTGFFLGTAHTVLLAEAGTVRALRRGEGRG
jgi:ribose 5-phosphate isomerase A